MAPLSRPAPCAAAGVRLTEALLALEEVGARSPWAAGDSALDDCSAVLGSADFPPFDDSSLVAWVASQAADSPPAEQVQDDCSVASASVERVGRSWLRQDARFGLADWRGDSLNWQVVWKRAVLV
jgi:hypothetical protein